jgi:hypothetical protein
VRFIECVLERFGESCSERIASISARRLAIDYRGGIGQQTAQPIQQRIDFVPLEHSGLDEELRSRRRHKAGIVLHQLFDLLA